MVPLLFLSGEDLVAFPSFYPGLFLGFPRRSTPFSREIHWQNPGLFFPPHTYFRVFFYIFRRAHEDGALFRFFC